MKFISKKTLIFSLLIFFILITLLIVIIVNSRVNNYASTDKNNTVEDPLDVISIPVLSTIEYTHPTNAYSFDYPDTWEFLPERLDMGMRPKAYCCTQFNEIVTVLLFELDGKTFETLTSEFDGVSSANWTEFTNSNGEIGYSYTHTTDNLSYVTNWFTKGNYAIKMMFRIRNVHAPDGHTDNSDYREEFNSMLNSLRFN